MTIDTDPYLIIGWQVNSQKLYEYVVSNKLSMDPIGEDVKKFCQEAKHQEDYICEIEDLLGDDDKELDNGLHLITVYTECGPYEGSFIGLIEKQGSYDKLMYLEYVKELSQRED